MTPAQRKVPALYCGHAIVKKHDALSIMDTEETLLLAEEKQAFWLPISESPPVQSEPVLKEISHKLPTISLVKDSFNNMRSHVDNFDKSIFHMFDQGLAKAITDMKVVFNQMDSDEQYLVHPAVNSLATIIDYQSMEKSYLDEYNECVNLKAELSKKNEMVKGKDTTISNLKKHIANLKGKDAADCSETAKEHADTLRDSVEQARAQQPLDSTLEYACKFTTRIHELLVYVSATCPSSLHVNEKLVAITPMNKSKKVRFEEPKKLASNTPTLADSKNSKITNQPLLTSTRVKSSTSASGSQPSGNTKKNRISRTTSSN
ncbi:hypothetical protein Tco_1161235 [Tanacetum coccineum]